VTLETPTGFASVTESTGSKLNKNEKIHVEKETKRELAKTPQSMLLLSNNLAVIDRANADHHRFFEKILSTLSTRM
jgi:hypothetical protein